MTAPTVTGPVPSRSSSARWTLEYLLVVPAAQFRGFDHRAGVGQRGGLSAQFHRQVQLPGAVIGIR
ncbi:MAG: hypothetical protein ACRDOI_47160 [Trebonia sp.]